MTSALLLLITLWLIFIGQQFHLGIFIARSLIKNFYTCPDRFIHSCLHIWQLRDAAKCVYTCLCKFDFKCILFCKHVPDPPPPPPSWTFRCFIASDLGNRESGRLWRATIAQLGKRQTLYARSGTRSSPCGVRCCVLERDTSNPLLSTGYSNREADQRLCFRYTDSTTPVLSKSETSFVNCAARFVSDLVGNPEDRFSNVEAHMPCIHETYLTIITLSIYDQTFAQADQRLRLILPERSVISISKT